MRHRDQRDVLDRELRALDKPQQDIERPFVGRQVELVFV